VSGYYAKLAEYGFEYHFTYDDASGLVVPNSGTSGINAAISAASAYSLVDGVVDEAGNKALLLDSTTVAGKITVAQDPTTFLDGAAACTFLQIFSTTQVAPPIGHLAWYHTSVSNIWRIVFTNRNALNNAAGDPFLMVRLGGVNYSFNPTADVAVNDGEGCAVGFVLDTANAVAAERLRIYIYKGGELYEYKTNVTIPQLAAFDPAAMAMTWPDRPDMTAYQLNGAHDDMAIGAIALTTAQIAELMSLAYGSFDAVCTPSPVIGRAATLSCTNTGAASYTWSCTARPAGAPDPEITPNGTAAARVAVVTVGALGSYTFAVAAGAQTADVTVMFYAAELRHAADELLYGTRLRRACSTVRVH
jgi:hypothetical protein